MELKIKDKKLLLELFQNSKQSHRQLAKKIGVAKETISNRIEYFKKEEYIKDFSCKINYSKLGFEEYNIFIRLKNISEEKIHKLISYLENLDSSTWIGKAFGKYDFKIAIIVKKSQGINEILFDISQKFSTQIDTLDYFLVIEKFKASHNLFLKNLIGIEPSKPNFNPKSLNLNPTNSNSSINFNSNIDEIDRKILYSLGQNPKQSIVLIAQNLELTTDIIKYRIKKLEQKKIIQGYSLVFNGNKFNKIWCLVLLNFNLANIDNFKSYLKEQDFLSSYAQTLGMWNFNVTFFANNIEELYFSLEKIRAKYSEDIKNFEILIFFELYKYPKIPLCITKNI